MPRGWYRAEGDRNSSQASTFQRQSSIQRGWSKSAARHFFAKASRDRVASPTTTKERLRIGGQCPPYLERRDLTQAFGNRRCIRRRRLTSRYLSPSLHIRAVVFARDRFQ